MTVRQIGHHPGRHLLGQGPRAQQVHQGPRASRASSPRPRASQLRVTGKKRDDLQGVIAALKAEDFGVPLQFNNFRD